MRKMYQYDIRMVLALGCLWKGFPVMDATRRSTEAVSLSRPYEVSRGLIFTRSIRIPLFPSPIARKTPNNTSMYMFRRINAQAMQGTVCTKTRREQSLIPRQRLALIRTCPQCKRKENARLQLFRSPPETSKHEAQTETLVYVNDFYSSAPFKRL